MMPLKTVHRSHLRVAGLVICGFFVGVIINQYGLVMEGIRLRVELLKSDESFSPNATLQQLMSRLPHLSQSAEASTYLVPNVVHYFWFMSDNENEQMSFVNFVSVLSVYRAQRPDAVWFHCNHLPSVSDFWWGELWKLVPLTVIHHDYEEPDVVHGMTAAQESAVIATLLRHGGIFVNWNVLVLQSLNPLRNYSTCFGKESDILTDIILSGRNALFLQLINSSLQSHQASLGGIVSSLSVQQPDLLHLESVFSDVGQSASDTENDWHTQYIVRIPAERKNATLMSIRANNDVLSAAMRYIYYGSPELLSSNK